MAQKLVRNSTRLKGSNVASSVYFWRSNWTQAIKITLENMRLDCLDSIELMVDDPDQSFKMR
jgi:hypothetical protein